MIEGPRLTPSGPSDLTVSFFPCLLSPVSCSVYFTTFAVRMKSSFGNV